MRTCRLSLLRRALPLTIAVTIPWAEVSWAQTSSANKDDSAQPGGSVKFGNFDKGYAFLGPAGPYFPVDAARRAVSGIAKLKCKLGAKSALDACSLISEAPKDTGFGPAALVLARRHAIVFAPQETDPQALPGDVVTVDVPFAPPSNYEPRKHRL